MNLKNIDKIAHKVNKIILDNNLEKIIEMTYSYKELGNDTFYNITLFYDYAGIDFNSEAGINYENLKNIVKSKLNHNINEILDLINDIKDEPLDEKGKILYKSLIYIKKILKITLLGLEFELEKAGYLSEKSNEEKNNIIKKIEEIEEENFGFKIKNNFSEIRLIHDFLFSLFVETKSHITEEEQLFFLGYINKLNTLLGNSDLKIEKIKIKKIKNNFWSKEIGRDEYIILFNFILKYIYNLPQEAIITDASSIYDGEKFLEIPNKDTHSSLSTKRVLELIVHEIESHYINSYNNKILLGNFRGARNLEKEEGLAKSMESFLYGDDENHSIFVPTYMAKILFSELYDGDEFYKFVKIYNKMHTLRRHPINEFLRQKRNYSLSLKGGQHKDISYGRGMIKTLDYLKNDGDFSLLFLGKIGFEDLDNIKQLYLLNKDKILFPIFIGDIISFYLESKENGVNFKFDIKKITNFLEGKYHFKGIENFNLEKNIRNKSTQIQELFKLINNIYDEK